MTGPRRSRTLGAIALFLALTSAGYLLLARPWMLTWGARPAEETARLPGDEIVADAGIVSTRAVLIDAPPAAVWPWLVQIGQGRGGFYSYTWLQNLFGCAMVNAERIHPEWQDLRVGGGIRIHPEVPPLPVTALVPQEALVMGGAIDPQRGAALPLNAPRGDSYLTFSWAFVLRPDGPAATRLIARYRLARSPSLRIRIAGRLLLEPITFVMERKMLLGIRARAERSPASPVTDAGRER